MAFDAGSVVGHFKLDGSEWASGAQQVTKHNSSLTASIFKASMAYDLFKQAVRKAIAFVKDGIGEYSKHEKAVAQTEAVLKSTAFAAGMTRNEIVALSDSLMGMTGIEHDNILAGENLLLTFTKIGKDIFPQATETMLDMAVAMGTDAKGAAIQLGKALQDPVLGVTALRRVGVNFNQAQTDVIKNLVNTGHAADAQAMILKELQIEFGGSARAARDTFGGALANLGNQVDEVKESLGGYVATAARPFVESMAEMTKGVAAFLNSKEGMDQIVAVLGPLAGGFAVAFEMGKQLWDMLGNFAGGVVEDIKNGFGSIVGKGNESSAMFSILGGVVKVVGMGFTIMGKAVHGIIQYIVDLVEVGKNSVTVLMALGDALAHPFDKKKWEEVGKAGAQVWESVKKTAEHVVDNTANMIQVVIEDFKSFSTEAEAIGGNLEKKYLEAKARLEKSYEGFMIKRQAGNALIVSDTGETTEEVKALWTDTTDEVAFHMLTSMKAASVKTDESWKETFDALKTDARAAVKVYGWFSKEAKVAIDALTVHAIDKANQIAGFFSDALGKVSEIMGQRYENELTAAENAYLKEKQYIEANVTDEADRSAQLASLDSDYAKKTAAIKKRQFESQKEAAIIGAVISTAEAVMKTFVAAGGWPWGIIPAAIMGALGAAQIAAIASQPTPEFAAKGGVFTPGTDVVVGEMGPELLRVGSTSRVVPNDQARFGGGVQQDIKFYGDINSDVDLDLATRVLARRVKAAVRSA